MKNKLFLLLATVSVLSLVGCKDDKDKNKNNEEKKEKSDDLMKEPSKEKSDKSDKVAMEEEINEIKSELGYGK